MSIQKLSIPLTIAAVLALSGTAWSQPASSAPPPYQSHRGVMVGFGLGLGAATCDGCDTETSFAFDFNIGGFINPRLALMYDVSGWIDAENDATLTLAANTFAAQYWVAPRVWIKGGLGLSQIRLSAGDFSDSDFGFGVTGAAGFEVLDRGSFALDLSGRLNILDFDGGRVQVFSAVAGFRWK